MAHGIRIWKLTEPTDAATLLATERIESNHSGCPWPCFAAQVPRDLGGDGPAPEDAARSGAVLLPGAHSLVACGTSRSLARLAEVWPGAGPALASTLERCARPPRRLAFSDGSAWNLAGPTRVMGVLNVTPDSFSDGGLFTDREAALRRAEAMLDEGADVVDIGGESTRPGAPGIDVDEESRRVVPVVEAIRREFPGARLSVDTRHAETARRALDAGANMINDVSGLADPAMAPLAAERRCPVIVMHMRGTPETMQRDTRYVDLLGEVFCALERSVEKARSAGVSDDRIVVDPGLGFGKSAAGNETLLRHLSVLRSLGLPILVGASRKSFIGSRTGEPEPARRLHGSLAAAVAAVLAGASIVRVHDVGATRRSMAVTDPLRRWIVTGARVP